MKIKYYIVLAFLSIAILFGTNNVWAQKEKLITVESVVNDEEGNPVVNAEVFGGSGFAKTDAQGRFSILMEADSKVIFEAIGFQSITLTIDEVNNLTKVVLKKSIFMYGSEPKVDLAFRKAYAGDVVSFTSTVKTNDIIGYDNSNWANDVLTGRTLGMLGSNNIRGLGIGINVADITGSGLNAGNALFIVDGLPRDIESLRLTEIESITVLKDVNAAVLYGSAAVNGVILITTKRGEAFKKKTDFTFNYGISTPRSLPNYLNSADYMTYYNQARANDGLSAQFADATIENFRSGNKYRYPNNDYYSREYMKSFKSYFDLTGQFSGGNEIAKYYSNVGWYSAGGILDFGEAANARNNVFNVRGNVDLKINNWIKTSIDGSSIFANNRSQRGSFWNAATTTRPYELTPLLPFDLIDPTNSLLVGRKNDVDGRYLLGGNASFLTNPIADSYAAGKVETIGRKFSFNNRVDFDLNKVTEGLSFHTNISFDYYTRYTQTIANEYSVYEPVWSATEDKITSLVQRGKDARPGTQIVGGTTFNRRFGFYGLFSYDRTFKEVHHVTGSLLGYGSSFKEQGDFQGGRHAHVGLQLAYTFDKKYMVDFSGAYINSVKLPEGNKGGFSPTVGLAWIINSEDFMSSVSNVDLLKIRFSAGMLNSDLPIGGFYYYDNRYTTSGSYAWNESLRSRSGVASSWSDNPNLGFAKRNELNLGIEGLFFKKTLGAEVNLFYDVYNDLIVRPSTTYPSFYTDFIPYQNFGSEKYQGVEFGLNFNKSFGDWTVFIGANALYVTSERTKVDEVYNNAYQYRQGLPADATFGLEALGLFQDQTEINNSPVQLFGTVKPGDIKYKDQNGDGYVDANDEVYIRRYQNPFSGGLQVKVTYKNLTLFVLGEGRTGADTFKESAYYWIDGNKKYSELVLGAWTPETKTTATYPRLSSQTNNNNNRRSTYWLYNNDYFQIQKIQLTWNTPESIAKSVLMKNLDLFVDASDVFQFAKNRKIRDLNTGGEPYYRTFSIGIKANF
ncbi:MAG: SusC/RagA family TonB-linked outer membrane protein [Prolixibacteraceae bacterium]|nr:SusC/RagA family TonB-linked outer membrane protein [Prolixibacteraceae bacterium]